MHSLPDHCKPCLIIARAFSAGRSSCKVLSTCRPQGLCAVCIAAAFTTVQTLVCGGGWLTQDMPQTPRSAHDGRKTPIDAQQSMEPSDAEIAAVASLLLPQDAENRATQASLVRGPPALDACRSDMWHFACLTILCRRAAHGHLARSEQHACGGDACCAAQSDK